MNDIKLFIFFCGKMNAKLKFKDKGCVMATIKDIAKLAKVSHGTVSNVLNKKGNVSAAKIKQVQLAAKQLGYTVNVQAQQLRIGATKVVGVIVPNNDFARYSTFVSSLTYNLFEQGYEIDIYYSFNSAERERVYMSIHI